MGCCVVAKPSELTSVTAFLLGELCLEAGFPAGVLNIVHGTGPGCGQALVEHSGIKAVSFMSGMATGRHLVVTAAPLFKKLGLELGDKNPNLVFVDCYLASAVVTSIASSFANQGQICLCSFRIFIEQPIYEVFKIEFLRQLKRQKIDDPLDPDTKQGALVAGSHLRKLMGYIRLAQEEGGVLLVGGRHATTPPWPAAAKTAIFSSPLCSKICPTTAAPIRRKSSGPWSRLSCSTPKRRFWPGPTAPNTTCLLPSGPPIWPASTA